MLTVLKYLGKTIAYLLLAVGLYLLLGVVLSLIPVGGKISKIRRSHDLWVSTNGVHTDLIFPLADVPEALRSQLTWAEEYGYVAFGWGDKGFYLDTPTWAELSPRVAVRAMFLPSPTAMHVTGYRAVDAQWANVPISEQQLDTLFDHITASFRNDATGKIQLIEGESYGADDHFYEAHGNYSAIITCNVWVNRALKKAGIRTALWAPSSWGIMRWL